MSPFPCWEFCHDSGCRQLPGGWVGVCCLVGGRVFAAWRGGWHEGRDVTQVLSESRSGGFLVAPDLPVSRVLCPRFAADSIASRALLVSRGDRRVRSPTQALAEPVMRQGELCRGSGFGNCIAGDLQGSSLPRQGFPSLRGIDCGVLLPWGSQDISLGWVVHNKARPGTGRVPESCRRGGGDSAQPALGRGRWCSPCCGSMWPWLSLDLGALPADGLPAPSQARSW